MSDLANFPEYNKAILVSVNDIEDELIPKDKVPVRFNVRSFLNIFDIEASAKSHQPGRRGRGTLLYDRYEVLDAIEYLMKYFKED